MPAGIAGEEIRSSACLMSIENVQSTLDAMKIGLLTPDELPPAPCGTIWWIERHAPRPRRRPQAEILSPTGTKNTKHT